MSPSHKSPSSLRKQAALVSLLVGFAMLAIKTSAYFLTNSAAIFSDALESVVHIAATAMALYSVILSSRPPDDSHPYGHGKIEFVSAGIEGTLIVIAAVGIIYEAVHGLTTGRVLVELDVGIYLTLGASVINLALGWFLIKRGRATDSITLIADGKHVLTDSYTSFGVVAGLGLVKLTGFELLDPIVAIIVAANILRSGYELVRISIGGLMDESDAETLALIRDVVNKYRTPEWIDLHHLRVIRSGRMRHVNFHLAIPFYWNVARAHAFEKEITSQISESLGGGSQVLIHLDPCKPNLCRMCQVDPCLERKSQCDSGQHWTISKMVNGPAV